MSNLNEIPVTIDLQELAQEAAENVEEWDNPWSWHAEHTVLRRGISGSVYHLGLTADGGVLINHDYATWRVSPGQIIEELKIAAGRED